MSAVEQAVLDEAMELSYQFRQNAALKNGLPDCRRISARLSDKPPEEPDPPAPPVVNITNHIPATPADPSTPTPGAVADSAGSSLLRKAAPFLIAGGLLGPAGWAAHALINPASPVAPTSPTPPAAEQPAPKDGDLLQWLQSKGEHLPGGVWPAK